MPTGLISVKPATMSLTAVLEAFSQVKVYSGHQVGNAAGFSPDLLCLRRIWAPYKGSVPTVALDTTCPLKPRGHVPVRHICMEGAVLGAGYLVANEAAAFTKLAF